MQHSHSAHLCATFASPVAPKLITLDCEVGISRRVAVKEPHRLTALFDLTQVHEHRE